MNLNFAKITRYKYERKNEKDCRLSVKANNNNGKSFIYTRDVYQLYNTGLNKMSSKCKCCIV